MSKVPPVDDSHLLNETGTVDFTQTQGAIPFIGGDDKVLGVPEAVLKSKSNVGGLKVLVVGIVGFCMIVGGWMAYKSGQSRAVEAPAPIVEKLAAEFGIKNTEVDSVDIKKQKTKLKEEEAKEAEKRLAEQKALEEVRVAAKKAEEERQKQQLQTAQAPRSGGQGQSQVGAGQNQSPPPPTPEERKLMGNVLLSNTGAKQAAPLPEKDAQDREAKARAPQGGTVPVGFDTAQNQQGGGSGIASRLQPTALGGRIAGKLPNFNYLLKKGTTIPCALKTGIDTTLPGFVICVVLNDVYSANGKTMLIERGATVFGEQQSSLKQGEARTFVLWTRIDNPSGIFANIDSPAADAMGYSGIPGYVDTHFWQRFGGAIMMSLIKDFSQAYSQRLANSTGVTGNQNPYQNSQNAAQDMATEALKNSINIPPTLYVNPATVVNVLVSRDVSFESVFELVD